MAAIARTVAFLLSAYGGVACAASGRRLAELPPVAVQVLLSTTTEGGASATINVLPKDVAECPALAGNVRAEVNGRALILSDAGGWRRRKGGHRYCEPPRFEGAGIPLASDGRIRLRDDSTEFAIDAPEALRGVTVALVQPSDGVMRPGTSVRLVLTPSTGTVLHATVTFRPTNAATASFFAEYPAGTLPLSVTGVVLSLVVPANPPPSAGSLQVAATLARTVSRCQGPASCTVQTGVGGAVAARVSAS